MKHSAYVLAYMFATLALISFMCLSVLPFEFWYIAISIGIVLSIFTMAFIYIGKSFK